MITNADIWTKIIALLNDARVVMDLPEYVVKKGAQHTIGGFLKPLILINKVGSTNLSWGGEDYNYKETNDKLYRIEQLLQEVMFQVTCLKRDNIDDANSASDAVIKLQMYLNGQAGLAKATELGIQLGRISNARHPILVTPSGIMTDSKLVHLQNISSVISVIPFGSMMEVKFVQP